MSKSLSIFKNAFLALVLAVPMMFMFAACDELDTKASCSKSNNYAESSTAALTEKVGETTPEFAAGYRMTLNMTMNLGEALGDTDITANAIVTKDAVAIKVTGKGDGENINGNLYVADGKVYLYESSTKTKQYMEVSAEQQDALAVLKLAMKVDFSQYDLPSLLQTINKADNAVVTQDGNRFKVVIETKAKPTDFVQLDTNQTIYINFDKNGNLEAFETEVNLGDFMKTTVVMSSYNGSVSLPNFKDYVKVDSFDDEDDTDTGDLDLNI